MHHTTPRLRITGKLALALLLSVNTASMFGMLRSVKRFYPARINAMHYSRARRLMHKIVPAISMQKSRMYSQINNTKEELEKKLERLTNQLKLCTSFRKLKYKGGMWGNARDRSPAGNQKEYDYWINSRKEEIEHGSMWRPSDVKKVKACCDKCFDEWVKTQEMLELWEPKQ